MVSFTSIALALAAATASLAVPLDGDFAANFPEINFDLGELESNLTKRQSYSTDYTTGSGSVNYSPSSTGPYTVTFSGASDFVVGKGWNPGNANAVTYSGSFSASSGTVTLALYGWTTSPLVEWYVIENYNIAPSGGQISTVSTDGGTYNILINTRTNEPSIEGTATFKQVKSVRTSTRSSGTITLANHFAAWKNAGLSMGTYNLEVMATEGYNSAGGSVSITALSH
ncbi:Uu.00g008370.m01.CDS01 [Anthostomella pinea]|uniref:Endo-1,4-beta-xylanase n=1 Tax=Anthostomella pinea TaxID=933095 RepID=A0AAI8VYE6_9PEZI|nr:Uu.00g008370.m01.CDS01 [Anthostomella pinea]